MKKLAMVAVVGLLGLILAKGVLAQPGRGPGGGQVCGWGAGYPYSCMYTPKTVETLSGYHEIPKGLLRTADSANLRCYICKKPVVHI